MQSSWLEGSSAAITWGLSQTTRDSKSFRALPKAPTCTSSRSFSHTDSLSSGAGYYLHSYEREAGQCPLHIVACSKHFRSLQRAPTCTNSRSFFHRDRLFSGSGFLPHSFEREAGRCTLQIVAWKRQGLRTKVSSKRALNNDDEVRRIEDGENGGGNGDSPSNCLYLKETIADGEVVEFAGSIVIFGDVKPRGHVLADGDVIVLGRLEGHVHAGRAGDKKSVVFATAMEPRELRIYDSALFCPTDDKSHIPKMAVFSPDSGISICPVVKETAEKRIAPPLEKFGPEQIGIGGQVEKQIATPLEKFGPEQVGIGGQVEKQIAPPLKVSGQGQVGIEGESQAQVSQQVHIHQIESVRNQRAAQVALVTGVYISIAGMALFGFPKVLFGILFDLGGVTSGWVQVGAILAMVFGVYYIGTAIGDLRGMNGAEAFYLSTVVGRVFLFFSFFWLVLTGAVPSPLLLVGAVNLVGAMVMLKALLKPHVQETTEDGPENFVGATIVADGLNFFQLR